MIPRRVIPYTDPLRAGRHPFQTFLLFLCLMSAVPLLIPPLGQPAPEVVENELPGFLVVGWGVCLFGGAAIALAGSFWPSRTSYGLRLALERAGLYLSGSSALIYGSLVLYSRGTAAITGGLIIFAFGAACLVRAHDIATIFRRAKDPDPDEVATEDGH